MAAASLPSPVQESVTSAQQDQAAEQQQDATTEEKHVQGTSFYSENEVVKAIKEQEETTVTNPKNDSQLASLTVHTEDDTIKNGKDEKEKIAEECNQSASPACTDQRQVLLPAPEQGDISCVTAMGELVVERENSHCDLERNPETSQEETSQEEASQDVCMVDVKEITMADLAMPVRKKRRMGMCGLTEKERGYILQTQKRENGQERLRRVERQMSNSKADLSAEEEIISAPPPIPTASVTEPREVEIKSQSSPCGELDRSG